MGTYSHNLDAHSVFTVTATPDPAVLPRVLGFFAQDNMVPVQIKSRVFAGGDLVIDINVPDLSDQRASVIAEKLRQLVPVKKVRLEQNLVRRLGAA